jgi:hypothetical protein
VSAANERCDRVLIDRAEGRRVHARRRAGGITNEPALGTPDKWGWYAAWVRASLVSRSRVRRVDRCQNSGPSSAASGSRRIRMSGCRRTSETIGDVNPPMHAWTVFAIDDSRGTDFVARVFHEPGSDVPRRANRKGGPDADQMGWTTLVGARGRRLLGQRGVR